MKIILELRPYHLQMLLLGLIWLMYLIKNIMRLQISPNRLVSDIQKDFNSIFPFLKIEFFRNKAYQQSELPVYQMVPHNQKIRSIQSAVTGGDMEIHGDMKVKDVENLFKLQFSLLAQVFRRSGNLWLQTTMTDNWTLAHQNEHGREISSEVSDKMIPEKNDYDLNRDADT